jgi:predicted MPP superfamily phosphohydrolase
MQPIETIRVILFLGLVVFVYVAAAGILLRLAGHRLGIATLANRPREVWFRMIILGLAALGTLCIAYGFFIEPYRLEVKHVRIESPKLPGLSRPIRVVHISDLHSEARPRLEPRLPAVVAAEKPDLIVFTGDALNSPAGLPVFKDCLSRLAGIAPTFAVRGNWDAWYWSDLDLFGGTGAYELRSESVRVTIRGVTVRLAGVPVGRESHIGAVLNEIRPDEFGLFLYHYPDEIIDVARRQADLYCAGHIHGGQIALPFYGALVTLSRLGKRFEAGLYRVGATWLYVNRGIGMEGGKIPRVRFCARPEVTVIDVHPSQGR